MPYLQKNVDERDDSNYDSDGGKSDIRKIHGDAAGLDGVEDDYNDSDDEEFNIRKFHGNAVGLDDVDDD